MPTPARAPELPLVPRLAAAALGQITRTEAHAEHIQRCGQGRAGQAPPGAPRAPRAALPPARPQPHLRGSAATTAGPGGGEEPPPAQHTQPGPAGTGGVRGTARDAAAPTHAVFLLLGGTPHAAGWLGRGRRSPGRARRAGGRRSSSGGGFSSPRAQRGRRAGSPRPTLRPGLRSGVASPLPGGGGR